jgi:hypothetical protein
MIYEILNEQGLPINRIVADYDFVNKVYPGRFREATDRPADQEYEQALVDIFDRVAQSKRYDNRLTCAMRASYEGPYKAEGVAFGLWMDTCYATCYDTLAKAQADLLPYPSIDQMLAGLPEMIWPVVEEGAQ